MDSILEKKQSNSFLEEQQSKRWLYLIIGVVMMLLLGLIYAWSVFRVPIQQEFGWSAAETSITFSISMMMFCIGGLVSGILTGKKGHRVTLICCAICLAVGFISASRIDSLLGIYITYGGLCGFGVGLGYNAIIGTVLKWFPDKQGLISGVILMGFGFGSMILGTLGASLITSFGWRTTFVIFGVAFLVIFLVGAMLLRIAPEELSAQLLVKGKKVQPSMEEISYKDMLRRKNFWLFFIWAVAVSSAGLVIMNISATYANFILGDNLTRAAVVAGIISITNGIGRVIIGQLFDMKGYKFTMIADVLLFMISGIFLILSFTTKSSSILVIAFIFAGFAYGGISPNISAFIAHFFGKKNYTLNYGIAYLNLLIASIIGPLCGGGSYVGSFVYMIIFGMIALVLAIAIK